MSYAAAISAHLDRLAQMRLPDSATDAQVDRWRAEISRLDLLIGGQRALQAAEQAEAPSTGHDPGLILLNLAAGQPGVSAADLVAQYRVWQDALRIVQGAAPAPASKTFDPAWYLAQLRAEFTRHKWPATLEGAAKHWAEHGNPQGRRGWAGGPGWGPREEEAPPGIQL